MPFLRRSKAFLPRVFLRGWQTSGTYVWQRGTPIPVTTTSGISGNFAVRRPDRVAGSSAAYDISTARSNAENGLRWFNTPAFINPPEYRLGTAARTYSDVRRNNYRNIKLARNFVLHEQMRLQFRCEFLNALNQVVFGTPGTDVATPATFGFVTTQGNTPRNIQIVLRLTF